jgi:RNA polymerase sigma-70 factor (ECF subfamily)
MLYQGVEARRQPVGETFEEFYRTRASGLRRYAATVTDQASADDACQEAWLRIWRSWGSADAERLDAWARQIVRNCCLSGHRPAGATASLVEIPAAAAEPEEIVVSRDEADAVTQCIQRLPGHLRDTLWLREVMGQSYADIAQTLGIPVGTVMSRLHTARRKLARKLAR